MLRKKVIRAENNNDIIERKPESDRLRLVWAMTIVAMIGVAVVGFGSISRNLSGAGSRAFDLQGLPQMPDMQEDRIVDSLGDGKELVSQYIELTNEQWGEVGGKYLAENNLLGEEKYSTLKLESAETEEGKVVLVYGQYHKDVRVQGGGVRLEIDLKSKEVMVAQNEIKRGIDIAVDPVVAAKDAVKVAQGAPDISGYVFSKSSLLVVPIEGQYYLAWEVIFKADKSKQEKTVFVGALRGNIIASQTAEPDQKKDIAQ
jgi:hypothetical protein